MSEYKTISITNVSLSEDDWQTAIRRLNNLDKFIQVGEDKIICLSCKSTKKLRYSIDCGAITTEYDAFRLGINFYIDSHLSGVRIEEMN